jgi:hypothetical protein
MARPPQPFNPVVVVVAVSIPVVASRRLIRVAPRQAMPAVAPRPRA